MTIIFNRCDGNVSGINVPVAKQSLTFAHARLRWRFTSRARRDDQNKSLLRIPHESHPGKSKTPKHFDCGLFHKN